MFRFLNIFNVITWPIFESIVMLIWFSTLLGHHHFSKRTVVITSIMLYVINMIGNGFESPLLRASLASTLSIILLFYIGWRQNIIRSKCILLLYASVSSLLAYWVVNFEMTMTSLVSVPVFVQASLDFLANILAVIFALVFRQLKYEWLTENFLKKHVVQLQVLLMSSLFLRIMNDFLAYFFAVEQFTGSIWWDFFLLSIILAIIFVPVISNQHELLLDKINQHDAEMAASQNYTQQLETKYSEFRFFKHDYKNILASLEYGIQSENMSDIRSTYYSVIKKSNDTLPDPKILNLKYIADLNLKSLILVKHQIAFEKSVSFNVEINEFFDVIAIKNDVSFYRVIGILLDNAIESAEKTVKKTVTMLLMNCKEIVIVNSCTQCTDLTKTAQFGYSSKKNHSGFGLYFVQQYINQHDNIELTTIAEQHHFIQKMMFTVS
ncbi:Accessory gene regulator protein C [Leuconostoc gelidum subsp. gasicomitatum]|uniref:Accessory gene regulator protein C n=1 Tax=Leuconostoc gasicomitatum TaxID=115778 RepID=A0ABM9V523_9LACO|nr:GHKL domain-containing protein [Leuconostoc gasicomitatum]MBZ5986235.1 GHKL domain-containing protein [Leuconostoc gelidum subsp. gelidum]MBZ5943755.1 GHKL domain-containing protein [Leuconostoc gasicomitatum]MBZ5945308.1 GHKL domain-containing protein [Leuconostoc gasicomitatum]MBZ5948737.1 GHKL domain-containing protein [Leuconostoc gasicomitatum]MBZ5951758.1 GHKL domain-containing protein [Leuconostoc gasicomitatum]